MLAMGFGNQEAISVPDYKLAVNEHERITQIYTQRNLHTTREKKHAECEKIH